MINITFVAVIIGILLLLGDIGMLRQERDVCHRATEAAMAIQHTEDALFEYFFDCKEREACEANIKDMSLLAISLRLKFADLAKQCY